MWNAGNVRLRLVTPIGVGHGPRAKEKKVRKFWAADTTTAVQDPEDPERPFALLIIAGRDVTGCQL